MPSEPAINPIDMAYAVVEHVTVMRHSRAAGTARSLVKWYSSPGRHGLAADLAECRLVSQRGRVRHHAASEGLALGRLNLALRAGGAKAGDEVALCGVLYRVTNEGCPAVRLGSVIPTDVPPVPDDERDELAERRSEYAAMTRTPA